MRASSLSWLIVVRSLDFMCDSFENDLTTLALVTGNVRRSGRRLVAHVHVALSSKLQTERCPTDDRRSAGTTAIERSASLRSSRSYVAATLENWSTASTISMLEARLQWRKHMELLRRALLYFFTQSIKECVVLSTH